MFICCNKINKEKIYIGKHEFKISLQFCPHQLRRACKREEGGLFNHFDC